MAINFPSSPSVNQTYSYSGRTWKWNGEGWALVTDAVVTTASIEDGTIVNADISASAAIADTKLATISTAGKVSNSATTATSANTASAIVARDASGNFTAGTITAALNGNAATVTNGVYTSGSQTLTGVKSFNTSNTGIANANGGLSNLEAIGTGGAAFMTFHRPNLHAAYFGVDSDNVFKIGGWSLGANAYPILHSNNYNTYAPTLTGTGASGTWGISISGNAATVTNGVYTSGDQTIAGNKTFSGTTTLGNVVSGFTVTAQNAGAGEGGEFSLAKPSIGSLSGNVILDINTNSLRIFENGGSFRGVALDITGCGSQSALIHSGFQIAGNRNRIINGAMAIDQRNSGASQTFTAAAALAYSVDRWYGYCTGANVTGQRVQGATVGQFYYRFTGAASVTAIGFGQRIEQLNSADLAGTTATLSASLANSVLTTVTWTAYYATTADTFGTLASPTRTQIATGTFTVNSTVTRYSTSISIPAAATTGIEIVFTVGAQTSGTWTIGDVQLEQGSVATPFERRSHGAERALAQRYYEEVDGEFKYDGTLGGANISVGEMWFCSVNKRATPTVSVKVESGTNAGNFSNTIAKTNNGAYCIWEYLNGTVIAGRNKAGVIRFAAEL